MRSRAGGRAGGGRLADRDDFIEALLECADVAARLEVGEDLGLLPAPLVELDGQGTRIATAEVVALVTDDAEDFGVREVAAPARHRRSVALQHEVSAALP